MRAFPRANLVLSLFASVVLSTASLAYAQPVEPAVPMASGGVGEEDFEALAAESGKFNAKILFTESNGEYVSDVAVSILTTKGKEVASTVTDGPVLLLKLKPGTYKLKATEAGRVKEHSV